MRLRRVKLDQGGGLSLAVCDAHGQWIPLKPALELMDGHEGTGFPELRAVSDDMLAFLRGGERLREQARMLLADLDDDAAELDRCIVREQPQLPFPVRSFRAFSIFEAHMIQSARVLAQRFFPPLARKAITGFELVTGRTFPLLRPKRGFYEHPAFYMGNHTAFFSDGETIPWPRYSQAVDYELELGFVLGRPVRDVDAREGRDAIAGFFLIDDFSARDTQAEEYRHGVFGPVVRSKTFANSLAATVVTADELADRAEALEGVVRVNGEVWSEGTNAGATHSLGDMVAWASTSEQLIPGDVLSTGTFPGCSGLEIDRWLKTGDVVELAIPELGTLTNRIGTSDTPSPVEGDLSSAPMEVA